MPSTTGRVLFKASDWPHRVDVLRAVPQFDDAGGRIADATQVVFRELPCFVQVEKQEESLQYSRQELLGDYQVVTYINPGIRNGDRLIFQANRILNVVGITNDMELSVIYYVHVVERTP
jgi:hypothetical protein